MTTFDQRGQNVKFQYNAGENINFISAKNKIDALTQLNKINDEVRAAIECGALPPELGKNIQSKLEKAIEIAASPNSNKKSILNHLGDITTIIKDVASLGGLITAVTQAIEMIKRIF